jgi:hypothetical protein
MTTIEVIAEIAAERSRQIEVEGWTPEHDDEHDRGQLANAAACYANPDNVSWTDIWGRGLNPDGSVRPVGIAKVSFTRALRWPWEQRWWKPADKRRNLVKAAALLVAEIERLDRAKARGPAA